MEAVFLLSLCLVHEVLIDGVAVVDNSIGLIFNGSLLVLGDALEVSNVKMSAFDGLLGTILPDVRSEHLSA